MRSKIFFEALRNEKKTNKQWLAKEEEGRKVADREAEKKFGLSLKMKHPIIGFR